MLALTAGALTLGGPAAAAAKAPKPAASPCPVPDTGFQSCLRVLYKAGDGDQVDDVRITATLLRRVKHCPARSAKRRVTVTADDGTRLDGARHPGSCRRGIVSWRAAFGGGETAAWGLREGDTVHAAWSGVRNPASVEISGE
jgi:hypothetical protein